MDCVGNQDTDAQTCTTKITITYIVQTCMHACTHTRTRTHTHTHTHSLSLSHTFFYHHTLPFHSGRSQSHPWSFVIKRSIQWLWREEQSSTTRVRLRILVLGLPLVKPGANFLNCHSYTTALEKLNAATKL